MQEERRGRRRRMTERAIAKQLRIVKQLDWSNETLVKEPHRMAKHHALDCGIPGCVCCANPRRVFGTPTFQEQRLAQGMKADRKMYDE